MLAAAFMAIKKSRLILFLIPVAILLIAFVYFGGRYWWYRGHSVGTRTGVIRKVSLKGPPYCKYISAEMALQGTLPGQQVEIWEFSVDDDSEKNPLVVRLQEAEKKGDRITVRYRQDLHSLYRCTPSEYFVTAIEK